MSKFFNDGESSDSEEDDNEDEIEPQGRASKFVDSSSESEEERRVVKSAKDKRKEELENIALQLKNHRKIRDMAAIQTDFEELTKSYEKSKKVLEGDSGTTPRFFVCALGELEDYVNEVWKDLEGRKAMSKIASRALTQLRQKVKKYNKDNLEKEIAHWHENPDEYISLDKLDEKQSKAVFSDQDDDDDEDDDDDIDIKKGGPSKVAKNVAFERKESRSVGADESDSGEDDDSFGSDSDSSSDLSSEGEYQGNLAAKFLKKPGTDEKEKERREIKARRKQERAAELRAIKEKRRQDGVDEEGWSRVESRGGLVVKERPAIFAKDAKISHEVVVKKMDEIKKGRGKRGTDRNDMIEVLIELHRIAQDASLGLGLQVKILLEIIGAIFDYNPNIATNMQSKIWARCTEYYGILLSVLENHCKDLILAESVSEEDESLIEAPFKVSGCPLMLLERLDEEYTKMLQNTDAHSQDYVERLRDERVVCQLIDRLVIYMESRDQTTADERCRVCIRKIEHLYYKFDQEWARRVEAEGLERVGQADTYLEMQRLCKTIYSGDHQRIRTRSILCHIYFLALHDYWFEARDLMLMSNLQQSIEYADISTMILYNRVMVQLGLCAFRKGQFRDCHASLVDIQSSGRAKELLAQGLMPSRFERNPEQEKLERRRQMPYHMHINLELLECVYLVSAMLLEIPYIAAHEMDLRRRMISKNFHHVLKISERQTLVGPPETMREHIVAASKAMRNGDWRATLSNIINVKMNAKVWDLFFQADKVKEMLAAKVKEESLRTFLFTYGSIYDAISLEKLSLMFELDRPQVHSIISKMILSDELSASLDEPSACMIMHRTEPSHLQTLSLQLAEKVSALYEANEKLAECKQAGTGRSGGDISTRDNLISRDVADRDNIAYRGGGGGAANNANSIGGGGVGSNRLSGSGGGLRGRRGGGPGGNLGGYRNALSRDGADRGREANYRGGNYQDAYQNSNSRGGGGSGGGGANRQNRVF